MKTKKIIIAALLSSYPFLSLVLFCKESDYRISFKVKTATAVFRESMNGPHLTSNKRKLCHS
jgi:hypothetical protein